MISTKGFPPVSMKRIVLSMPFLIPVNSFVIPPLGQSTWKRKQPGQSQIGKDSKSLAESERRFVKQFGLMEAVSASNLEDRDNWVGLELAGLLDTAPWQDQLVTDFSIVIILGVFMDPLVSLESWPSSSQEQTETSATLQILKAAIKSIPTAARIFGFLCILHYWPLLQGFQHKSFLVPLPPPPEFLSTVPWRHEAPQVALTVWLALFASYTKRSLLKSAISGTRLGRVALYDKLLDLVLLLGASIIVLSELRIDYGMRLQSIFAAGSLGALTFSLASRDLAENIVAGIILKAWDAFDEGDDIRLGDGSEGTVLAIGLVETELCGYDNIVTVIPNAQLSKERVSNLSRITRSRFRQALRFQYKDIDKLPKILMDILAEIELTCSPSLITDGSKPFQAVLTKYEPDHIEAQVTCHFSVPPVSQDFVFLRQSVILAIAKAMQSNQSEFALPSINYKIDDSTSGTGRNSIL